MLLNNFDQLCLLIIEVCSYKKTLEMLDSLGSHKNTNHPVLVPFFYENNVVFFLFSRWTVLAFYK